MGLISSRFFYLKEPLVNNLINHFGMNLILFLLEFLIIFSQKQLNGNDRFLDLKQFNDLNIRDAEWLVMIQKHKTYKEIASKYNISEGTVRNRMNRIFKIIKCGDKIGFKNLYGDYKIFFGEKEICEEKNISNFEEI